MGPTYTMEKIINGLSDLLDWLKNGGECLEKADLGPCVLSDDSQIEKATFTMRFNWVEYQSSFQGCIARSASCGCTRRGCARSN